MRILVYCFLFLAFTGLQAQISRFREYRKLIAQAEYKIATDDIPGASELYQQALRGHGYLMVRDLTNAALCAAIQNETVECALLMREMLRLGVPVEALHTVPEFEVIWKDPASAKIMSKEDAYAENGKKYRNARYQKSLDSLNILKDRYLNGNAEAGKQMAAGLLAVWDMWGMPGEQYTGVIALDGSASFDGVVTEIALGAQFRKYHGRLSSTLLKLLERGCVYPDKAARWLEAMSRKKILSTQTAANEKSREKLRIRYMLPPANLEYEKARYREQHPESSFILR